MVPPPSASKKAALFFLTLCSTLGTNCKPIVEISLSLLQQLKFVEVIFLSAVAIKLLQHSIWNKLVWGKSRSLSPTSISWCQYNSLLHVWWSYARRRTFREPFGFANAVLWELGRKKKKEHAALNLVGFSFIWRDIVNFHLSSECPGNKGSGIAPQCLGCCLDCFQHTGMWWCGTIYILNENVSCNYQNFTHKEKLLFSQLSGNRADLIAGSESGLKIVI